MSQSTNPSQSSKSRNQPDERNQNLVVIIGTLSSDPVVRELPSGDQLVQYEVTTTLESGTITVPVVWFTSDGTLPGGTADARVAILGAVRRRFYRANGRTQSSTEVVASRIVVGADKRATSRLLAAATRAIG